jgi:type II secretory pathway pseudopilin PulG
MWCWFEGNSSQLQAIGSIGAVIVAGALGVVAVRQARAADEQAKAAKEQAEAAKLQVEAARKQIETSMLISDTQTEPNISITAHRNRDNEIVKDTLAILNNGGGTAHGLKLRYRDQSSDFEIPLPVDRLVMRDSFAMPLNVSRAAKSGLSLSYKTSFNSQYELEFGWNGNIQSPISQKLRLICRGYPISSSNDK